MTKRDNFIDYIADALRDNWERLALTDFEGQSLQYRDVARKIEKIHILFREIGIAQGDRIAICSRNCSHWAVAFLATVSYGTVAVPILHEFKADNIHHLVDHSGAKLLFADASAWENLDPDAMAGLEGALLITDFSILFSRNKNLEEARHNLNRLFGERFPERFTPDDINYQPEKADTLAVINYTSGSTGFSKGVMLTYGNLWSNLQYTIDGLTFLEPGDGLICMLPLAHMFGLMVEFLHPFVKGCHVSFLTRTPSPRIIMEAFARVKPKLIVTVPLVIEKIIRTRVFPLLDKPLMKLLLNVPFVDDRLLARIKNRLTETFGGNVIEIIIGGAGLNREVERFLRRIHFPYTVGYGMTECGPLVAYTPWETEREGSCGRVVDRMEARIDSSDPVNVPGVLWVRGSNVMKGYYKNPEATEAVMKDGWMNTGDICQIDADGFLYIRGRDKSMILGPSGQNIYPEEIELQLNAMPYVGESLVVDRDGRITALIHPDLENSRRQGLSDKEIEDIMSQNINTLNNSLPAYSRIADFHIMQEEFEKTPKHSIRRYLYQQ